MPDSRSQEENGRTAEQRHTTTAGELGSIYAILRRLPRSGFLRDAALFRFAEVPRTPDEFDELVAILDDPSETRWQERIVAAWTLGRSRLGPRQAERATKALCEVLDNRQATYASLLIARLGRAVTRTTVWIGVLSVLFTPLYVAGAWLSDGYWSGDQWLVTIAMLVISILLFGCGALLLFSPLAFVASFLVDADRTREVRAAAATALGRIRLPKAIDSLARAYAIDEPAMSHAVKSALYAVLCTLDESHYTRTGPESVPLLCRALRYETNLSYWYVSEERALQLLRALGSIGDGRAVRYVARLAERGAPERLRKEACRILPTLVARQIRESERATLLRGSERDHRGQHLLRPITVLGSSDTEHLLVPRSRPPLS